MFVELFGGGKANLVLTDVMMPGGMSGVELARLAAGTRPDLVCLPETFPGYYTPRPTPEQQSEALDGPTVTAISAFARSKRCYVVTPITLKRDDEEDPPL